MALTLNASTVTTEDILSYIGNAVFLVGHDNNVTYVNQHFADLFDISPDKVTGRPYSSLLSQIAARSTTFSQTLKHLLATVDHVSHFPVEDFTIDKPTTRHLQATFFPLPGNNGQGKWGGSIQDVSTHHERSVQSTKVFLNLIDELRSSLVFIVGSASTLLSEHYSWNQEELENFLKIINNNAQDTIQLLENVRDISKLDLKELDLRSRPTNLKRLVQYVSHKLAEEGGYFDLKLNIEDSFPMVDLDPIRMSRAFHNLIASILKLSFGTQIKLSAQQNDDHVQIDILYHGTKLPEALHADDIGEILQERNYHSHMTRDLGLRLYIAQGVLHAHDGHLWTEESHEQQVAVHIVLPLKRHSSSASLFGEDHTMQPKEASVPRPNNNAKILIVEQDSRVAQQLRKQLTGEGYQVIRANEGATALELAAIEVPDVILLSNYLPDADALTTCEELRAITSMPIIMLAGNSEEETIIQSLNAGADDYIVKPVRAKELLARIQANLRRAYLSDFTDKSNGKTLLKAGGLNIDFAQRRVTFNDQVVNLTPIEYKLLHYLAVNAGRILTHEQLVTKIWGDMCRDETQYLWVNISRLRSKIERDPSNPQYIVTERGVGYSFHNPDDDDIGYPGNGNAHNGYR